MPCDDIVAAGPDSPLGAPLDFEGLSIGNRLAMQPMEGWDCLTDGRPSDNTRRRWQRFGQSGAQDDLGRRGLRGAARRPRQP